MTTKWANWDLIIVEGSEWTYRKESGKRHYRIFDPSGKDVACIENNLFVVANDLRKHQNSYEFRSDIPQHYIDGLLAVKDLIFANPENDNKSSIIELSKETTQDITRLVARLRSLYPDSNSLTLADELLAKVNELSLEIENL